MYSTYGYTSEVVFNQYMLLTKREPDFEKKKVKPWYNLIKRERHSMWTFLLTFFISHFNCPKFVSCPATHYFYREFLVRPKALQKLTLHSLKHRWTHWFSKEYMRLILSYMYHVMSCHIMLYHVICHVNLSYIISYRFWDTEPQHQARIYTCISKL